MVLGDEEHGHVDLRSGYECRGEDHAFFKSKLWELNPFCIDRFLLNFSLKAPNSVSIGL